MAGKNSTNSNSAEDTNTMTDTKARSASIDVGTDKGGNLLAAWRGIFHLLGGQATFDLVPGEGVVVKNFSTYAEYDPQTIVNDVSGRDRRVDLLDSLPILQGKTPPKFDEALDMTKWMQQYFRTPGGDGKSPQYIKDAIATYKSENGFPGRRGRPKKIIRIDELGKVDEATLSQVAGGELDALVALINKVRANQNAAATEADATPAESTTL